MGLRPARLDEILPGNIAKALHRALKHFDSMATSFIDRGVLVGLETHVSSPVRFLRNGETLSSSIPGFYTAGRGLGWLAGSPLPPLTVSA